MRSRLRGGGIGRRIGVRGRQPSVTSALRALAEKELIRYEPYGTISLTIKGKHIAKKVLDRHIFLRRFMKDILGADDAEANIVACKLEHVISDDIMKRLAAFVAYVDAHKESCASWDFETAPRH